MMPISIIWNSFHKKKYLSEVFALVQASKLTENWRVSKETKIANKKKGTKFMWISRHIMKELDRRGK